MCLSESPRYAQPKSNIPLIPFKSKSWKPGEDKVPFADESSLQQLNHTSSESLPT